MAFEKDVGSILAEANKYGDAIHMAKVAGMIRRDMLQHMLPPFNDFDERIKEVVPPSLLQFICMIEHGADIVPTSVWGFEILICNITTLTLQLLCQVQGRFLYP